MSTYVLILINWEEVKIMSNSPLGINAGESGGAMGVTEVTAAKTPL